MVSEPLSPYLHITFTLPPTHDIGHMLSQTRKATFYRDITRILPYAAAGQP